jgi:hypothetical protein
MKLTIISGATRTRKLSNTARIIDSFVEGFSESGHQVETYYLSDRTEWDAARKAFYDNDFILIAFPLYVENLPGPLLEFLASLKPKTTFTQLAFLVQGGFDEGCQLRCCEAFLKTLPEKLGCQSAGIMVKGGNFFIRFFNEKERARIVDPYKEMGRQFAKTWTFDTPEARKFAGPEHYSKFTIFIINTVIWHLIRFTFRKYFKREWGTTSDLAAQPYHKE